eukprot:CAMPEP_0169480080 /NCGR_PEP_ID=MMETSP1042-20121227/29368_1 /TAXON_ID=464988 /ORGANISM="Hemiselmis andersenii, Strain CCMP1180" /LENGTH=48 /DNA_ID= /DNA_START= /DNA_END= /DNA_ORIENTATION=
MGWRPNVLTDADAAETLAGSATGGNGDAEARRLRAGGGAHSVLQQQVW